MPKATTLEVPPVVYTAMRALLARAGLSRDEGGQLNLHDITLTAREGPSVSNISVGTTLSSTTHEGRVEFTLNGELTQMDLPKAREIVGMLQQAIEAAASDQMLYVFLTERVGLNEQAATMALLDFREIRQGSRGLVHPS